MSIKLMIDSASDISVTQAEELGITIVPLEVNFKNESFKDGVDLLPDKFYEKLVESEDLPTTSQINPFRWEEEFKKATANGDEIIVITLSSKISGTYSSALQASLLFDKKVHVVDSMNASCGERLLALYALELIQKGLSVDEIVEKLNTSKSRIFISVILNTLKYLKKGGRISGTVAFAGELLSIKPIVAMVDGEVKMIGKAMGHKKANLFLNSVVEKKGIDFDMPHAFIWSGNDTTSFDKYKSDSKKFLNEHADNMPEYIIGSTIGTHIGPGATGIAFFTKD